MGMQIDDVDIAVIGGGLGEQVVSASARGIGCIEIAPQRGNGRYSCTCAEDCASHSENAARSRAETSSPCIAVNHSAASAAR